jgi:hypothetical protein
MPLRSLSLAGLTAIFAIMFFCALPTRGADAPPASEPYRIPLSSYAFNAKPEESTYPRDVDAGTLRISFSNLVPSKSYDIHWHTSRSASPPLDITVMSSVAGVSSVTPCQKLAALAAAVWGSTSEPEVERNVAALRAFQAGGDCDDPEVKAKADAAIAATLWGNVIEAKIEPGSTLEIHVARASASGQPESVTFIFRGPEPSRFFQTYGFSYLDNGNQEFFTEKNAEGKFVIREKTQRSAWEPAGLLLVNYRLAGPWTSADLAMNLAGALSFDGDKPAVGVGLNFTFANNIGLVAGVAMSKQTRLRGQYRPGDDGTLLDADLASDQLVDEHTESTFFVGLSLNLSSNPFKKKPETNTETATGSK